VLEYQVRHVYCELSRIEANEEVNGVKLSARNVLKGKVKSIQHGAVNSEIIVQLPSGIEIVSIITKTAAQNLQLKEGKDVYAIIKATNVILGTD
jgi:molybdopterin-binding protein